MSTEAKRERWFYDTEFNEDGRTIELISIALVSESGAEYYAISSEFDLSRCNDWVKQNVLPHLPPRDTWKPRATIAAEIRALLLVNGREPELWAYFGDYDHVALCQLYGRMVDLPDGFPFLTLDLKQLMKERGVSKEQLPSQVGTEHDALADARWNREAWKALQAVEQACAVPAPAVEAWVPCEERLPEHGTLVLFWCHTWLQDATPGVGRFGLDDTDSDVWLDETQPQGEDELARKYRTNDVRCWKPFIPPPPKESR